MGKPGLATVVAGHGPQAQQHHARIEDIIEIAGLSCAGSQPVLVQGRRFLGAHRDKRKPDGPRRSTSRCSRRLSLLSLRSLLALPLLPVSSVAVKRFNGLWGWRNGTMNRTRRTIGLSAFVMLVVLGTGWAVERASHTPGAAAVSEPAMARDAVAAPVSREPMDVQPVATDSSQEYDRSDLLLSQG
jgi:hypothetical protein